MYGAEILACVDAYDRGFYIKQALQSIFTKEDVIHEVNVDSKGLYDTVTTLHEGREYRLKQTVQRIRDSFESEELDVLNWIHGCVNLADALTKHNPGSFKLIAKTLNSVVLNMPKHESYTLENAEWK